MLGNAQQSKVFHGVRYVLLGFDPLNKSNVLKKLIDGGAVDAGHIGSSCTHVIVHSLVYDDPLCIAARSNGKTLVTDLWVDHSFDVGIPLDITSIMYRPLRDLNGIPGAKSLMICLTGYQRQDREDIMTMVGLMGAKFSKPLIAHKVTHLICYKFEGEKYELAKKIKIKLVNHRWLEDCLAAWEILSEENYDKSGYELEMMEAQAKDSEEEQEGEGVGVDSKQHTERGSRIQHSFILKEETSNEPQACFAPKEFGPSDNIKGTSAIMEKCPSPQAPNLFEIPSNPYNTTIHAMGENDLGSSSKDVRTPNSEASKLFSKSYSRKTSRRTTPPMHSRQGAYNLNSSVKRGKLNSDKAFGLSSSTIPQESVNVDADCFKSIDKGSPLGSNKKQSGTHSKKRKTEVLSSSLKVQKISANTKAHTPEHPVMPSRIEGVGLDFMESEPVDGSTRRSPCKSNESAALDLVSSPIFKIIASEIVQEENTEPLQTYTKGLKRATLSSKPELGDVMSNPQPTIVEDQQQRNEAQDIASQPPCANKLDIEKSNTNTKSGGVGVSQSVHLAVENHVMQDILIPSSNTQISDAEKSCRPGNLELQSGAVLESDSKPLQKKMSGKKLLGPKRSIDKGKTKNQKGSILLKKNALMNDSLTHSAAVEQMENIEKSEMVLAAEIPEIDVVMEKADDHSKKLAGSKSVCADDETESQEDKEAPDEEKCDKVEGGNIAGKIVADEEQLKVKIVQMSAARGKKCQLKNSIRTENQVAEKITKGKKRSLSLSKKTSVPSVLSVCTEKAVLMDDGTKSPEQKEEKVGGDNFEAEPNNTTGLEAKDEGKKSQRGESTNTENPVQEKITKNKKRSLSKCKSITIPSVLCTTEQGASKDESACEDKTEKKETGKEAVPSSRGKTKRGLAENESKNTRGAEKENQPIHIGDDNKDESIQKGKKACKVSKKNNYPKAGVLDQLPKERDPQTESVWFILSGHRLQRKEFQQVIKRLKGRVCRDSHQWSYQATHFIVPDPIRRTEKFFAAAASGRWILRTEFLTASNQAGKFLSEEPYEWHQNGLSEDGAINLEAPRKWRLLKEKTGHGAFYGMSIIIYGECIAPPLDTLKRAVKAGDGTLLATSPPYTRFLKSRIDFAIVSPGMPRVDIWVQEFLRHEIPCVTADYLVEYVCKPGYSLDRHIQYNTHAWAEKSFNILKNRLQESVETEGA